MVIKRFILPVLIVVVLLGAVAAGRLDGYWEFKLKQMERDGARIFVDPKSLLYLEGLTLDYTESLMQSGFSFQNPNAKKSCGCGTSFTA